MFELINKNHELESIDVLFNKLFNNNSFSSAFDSNALDSRLSSDDKNYYLQFSLPGLSKKDVNLNYNNHYLYLSHEANKSTDNVFLNKSFSQRIKLPQDIDAGGIVAELKNGILLITIAKNQKKSEEKKILIK
mgnify:CR=1 FL=1|tara:strand:+ start:118 stop:516 length:399 start_codon:yes stop_codon:yes gene_type:complete